MLSYFDFKIFSAAFFRVVPNRVGGILTISISVETENNFKFFYDFQFMNLWVNSVNFIVKKRIFQLYE